MEAGSAKTEHDPWAEDEAPEVEEHKGRRAAVIAVVLAVVVVVYLLFLSGGGYTVKARFENASQVVQGNQVLLSGAPVGTVDKVGLAPNGEAELELALDDSVAPLSRDAKLTIRSTSLSGIANRFVELTEPAHSGGPTVPDGGFVHQAHTTSEVDLDAIFNSLDKPTRDALQRTIKGLAGLYRDAGPAGNRSIAYASPAISSGRRVVEELGSDQRSLERFVVDTAKLTTALADRREDVSGLITNLNDTTGALAAQSTNLSRAVGDLPAFMTQANRTFVGLRSTLSDLDPVIAATKPVAPKLRRFLPVLRRFAAGAVPVTRNLSLAVRRPGSSNDLVELLRSVPALSKIGIGPVDRNGATRRGALPETTDALKGSIHQLASFRPYTPELVGWFDDFGHSLFDANGGFAKIQVLFNAYTVSTDNLGGIPQLSQLLTPVQRALRAKEGIIGAIRRCPGAGERDPGDGSTPFTDGGAVNCDPKLIPPGR